MTARASASAIAGHLKWDTLNEVHLWVSESATDGVGVAAVIELRPVSEGAQHARQRGFALRVIVCALELSAPSVENQDGSALVDHLKLIARKHRVYEYRKGHEHGAAATQNSRWNVSKHIGPILVAGS